MEDILDGNLELKRIQTENKQLKNILTIELVFIDLVLLTLVLYKDIIGTSLIF